MIIKYGAWDVRSGGYIVGESSLIVEDTVIREFVKDAASPKEKDDILKANGYTNQDIIEIKKKMER